MSGSFDDIDLAQAGEIVEARLGLHFPPSRLPDLRRGLSGAARELGLDDSPENLGRLLQGPLTRERIEILASHLTVGETHFFRERGVFEALEKQVLPQLIRRRVQDGRRLRIWCAASCTGEEPYSLAMLLERLLPDIDAWNLSILATDINPRFLRRATEGIFKEWSFRDTDPQIKERYFVRLASGEYQLDARVRRRVTFSHLNLADDAYPSLLNNTNALDLILCRNVLIYFTKERILATVERLRRCLVEGGWLAISPTEASQEISRMFRAVHFPNAAFYFKDSPVGSAIAVDAAGPAEPDAVAPMPPKPRKPRPRAMGKPPGDSSLAASRAVHPAPVSADLGWIASLIDKGRYPEAEEALSILLRQTPEQSEGLALRARIAANEGRLQEALALCDRALARERMDPASHHLRATILEELGRTPEAEAALKTALYLDPEFALAHFALGHLALRQRNPRQAQRRFDNALSLLGSMPGEDAIPGAGGLTAGRLAEIARSMSASVGGG